jgi:hypothetical protein
MTGEQHPWACIVWCRVHWFHTGHEKLKYPVAVALPQKFEWPRQVDSGSPPIVVHCGPAAVYP